MLPIVFEWHWDLGHIIFMGLFYLALGVISLGLGYCLVATFWDLIGGRHDPHHGPAHGHPEPEEAQEAEASPEEAPAEAS